MSFNLKKVETDEGSIATLGEYHSWGRHKDQGGDRSNFHAHSGKILDLKDKTASGISHFFDYLVGKVPLSYANAIAVVPSSNADRGPTTGVHALADKLAEAVGSTNAGGCLVRHTSIKKKSRGGDRSIEVDLNSIRVENADLIKGKVVLLLDDVTTSHASLLACRRLLLEAGAKEVKMVALSRTV